MHKERERRLGKEQRGGHSEGFPFLLNGFRIPFGFELVAMDGDRRWRGHAGRQGQDRDDGLQQRKKHDLNQPEDDDKLASLKTKRLVSRSQRCRWSRGALNVLQVCECGGGSGAQVGPAQGRTIRQQQEHAAGENPSEGRKDLEKVTHV